MQRLDDVYERLAQIDADTAEARASAVLAGIFVYIQLYDTISPLFRVFKYDTFFLIKGLEFNGDMLTRPVREMSGGWRMRLALACALFRTPSLLILDEPSNHLDLHRYTTDISA